MEPQINKPEDTNNTNKNNTEEHNKDHEPILRPKAGILNQARRRPPNTGRSHTTGTLVINTLLKLKSSGQLLRLFTLYKETI